MGIQHPSNFSNITANNTVIFNNVSQLPIPVGGKHILAEDTQYIMGDAVTITNEIVFSQGSTIVGNGVFASIMNYEGTGTMLNSEDIRAGINNINLNCPNGQVFNITKTGPSIDNFLIENVQVLECEDYGFFDVNSTIINNSNCLNGKTSGMVMNGDGLLISIKEFFMGSATPGFKFLDFGNATAGTIEIENFIMSSTSPTTPGIGFSGLVDSGNVNVGNIATVKSCELAGNITPLENIETTDIRWDFKSNSANIPDTIEYGEMYIPSEVTVDTGTGNIGEYFIVNDANTGGTNIWAEIATSKFEIEENTGRMYHRGEKPVFFNSIVTATVEKTTGGADDLGGALFLNGVLQPQSVSRGRSNNAFNIVAQTGFIMNKDDYLEFGVANFESNGNLDVNISNMTTR